MSDRTAFLFADPSFVEGVARLVDFRGALNRYTTSSNPKLLISVRYASTGKRLGTTFSTLETMCGVGSDAASVAGNSMARLRRGQ